uniref:HTH cro/C1-type domain-containing protein n=3 Tax=Citrifermentans bremense TaxID=60035 RepID=A0A6S6M2V8_9BACT
MDLGLLQREAANKIGVQKDSIYNWERGVQPELRFMPKIIDFLGYVPFGCQDDILGKLAYYKLISGLSYKELGAKVGIHYEQLQAWLTGRTKPNKKSFCRLKEFLQTAP